MQTQTKTTTTVAAPETPQLKQDIAQALHQGRTLRSYGRTQHGLNGKDADLDAGGQCIIVELKVEKVNKQLRLVGKIQQYANICPATYEEDEQINELLMESCEATVMDFTEFHGEWSDDYWTFENFLTVSCRIFLHEYNDFVPIPESLDKNPILDRIAERFLKAINAIKSVRRFEKEMASLNKQLDDMGKPEEIEGLRDLRADIERHKLMRGCEQARDFLTGSPTVDRVGVLGVLSEALNFANKRAEGVAQQ